MSAFNAILTTTTCSYNCWYAKQEICHCSCGGTNHGILLEEGQEQPERQSRIDGFMYRLVEVGANRDIENSARMWRKSPGYKSITYGVQRGLDGEPDREAKCHSVWWGNEKGCPTRVKKATDSQLANWAELQGQGKWTYLLWVRVEMPDGELCFGERCPSCEKLCEDLAAWRVTL